MAPIQKAIRDLERCIRKKKEKGESTEALDKKLILLFDDKTISDQIQKEKRNSAKYHMIKFVERQKLVRKIRSIDVLLAAILDTESAESVALNGSKTDLMDKLAYVLYYPKGMKYVALFADTEGETVGKNEKLRLQASAFALKEWKNDKVNGVQDRVMRVILCEEKEEKDTKIIYTGNNNESGEYGEDKDDFGSSSTKSNSSSSGANRIQKNKHEVFTYGDKPVMPKKKKSKIEVVETEEEEVIDFPPDQEPDPFFLEEGVIEAKQAAKQSMNQKYPPENNRYKNNNFNNSGSSFGNYGGNNFNTSNYKGNKSNITNRKPAYGAGSFSSFTPAPTKQNARLQKWQSRKNH